MARRRKETCGDSALSWKKANSRKASNNCKTADSCKTTYCHQAPDRCKKTSPGGEPATARQACKCR